MVRATAKEKAAGGNHKVTIFRLIDTPYAKCVDAWRGTGRHRNHTGVWWDATPKPNRGGRVTSRRYR
jgi:hypothetical protein